MGMLDKLKEAMRKEAHSVDPAVFGSELALQTEWTPLKPKSGAHFCTRRLRREFRDGSLRFVGTALNKFFSLFFVALGPIVLGVALSGVVRSWPETVIVLLAGGALMAGGVLIW